MQEVLAIGMRERWRKIRRQAATKLALVAVAAIALSGSGLATPDAADAYNFPFKGQCGAKEYFDQPSRTMAALSHYGPWENNRPAPSIRKVWYRIYWGYYTRPPHPTNPYHHWNWAHCYSYR